MATYITDELPQELLTSRFDVTVIVPTYNHEKYIERCLKSVLSQDFAGSLGLVIVDDCSTDATLRTIEHYLARAIVPASYKVFLISHITNQFQRGRRHLREILNTISSEFFAICEGDDAWTDRTKIQKQFSFLASEAGAEFSVCGHDSSVCDDRGEIIAGSKLPENCKQDFDSRALKVCDCFLLTNTLFFRGNIDFPTCLGNVPNGDNVLWSTFGFHGSFKFMAHVGKSIYTKHAGGIWSSKSSVETTMMQAETFLRLARYYYQRNEVWVSETFLRKSYALLGKFGSRKS
mgnify:CR=1 FL=1